LAVWVFNQANAVQLFGNVRRDKQTLFARHAANAGVGEMACGHDFDFFHNFDLRGDDKKGGQSPLFWMSPIKRMCP
jgi:hypothetical protein